MKNVSKFEKTAARAWNFLNEGKSFLPIFVVGTILLSHGATWLANPWLAAHGLAALVIVLPLLLLYMHFDFPLFLRNYLWLPLFVYVLLPWPPGYAPFEPRLALFATGLYFFFTVFFWGTFYYRMRIGTPWNNYARFWKLVLKHSDSTSGNAQEQIPKFLLILSLWHWTYRWFGEAWTPLRDGLLTWGFIAGVGLYAWILHRNLFDWKPKMYDWFTKDRYPAPTEPLARRVYVIVLDGMRKERFYEANTPFLDKLRREGTEYVHMETIYPARTVVCFSSMHTGAYPREHGITSNLVIRYGVKVESVFDALRRGGKKGRLLGIAHLVDAFGDDVESITAVMKHDEADPSTLQRALKVVREQDPDLLTVQFIGTDQIGHARGVFYDDYIEKIEAADRLVETFVKELEDSGKLEKATLIVCADHGQADGIGGHGHLDEGERFVPFFVWGEGVARGRRVEARHSLVSLAATVTQLLGCPFPSHAHGPSLVDSFRADAAASSPAGIGDAAAAEGEPTR
ncbi:alkaline phosphatase family protein [Paenibacillus sp.]|uniref:alkaline phosphatase family protein n=1 Tax=Paenibacillus sp. TaxID=58172 RepID=UPI002D3003E5|nr:alkaline phosphatase family protein [Paenibacillus sp.]HZG54892.1 alkaline phosphatase family protein [Paenibacillus sp.]